jgi:hypothetical protein
MIKKSILIRQSLKLKNYNITYTKANLFLSNLKYLVLNKLSLKLVNYSLKKRILLLNIIKHFKTLQNVTKVNYLILKIFSNKGLVFKKLQAKAKGKGVQIKKKLSNITIIFSPIKLYKIFSFTHLII